MILPIAIRLGVVVCVLVAAYVGVGRLDVSVAVFDFRADENRAETFADRTYPELWVAGDWTVLDDARLWMPEDATYRVVRGPLLDPVRHFGWGGHFLRTLLAPRRETRSESAQWVFCYGCDEAALGKRFEVLSRSRDGIVLARRRS